MLVTFDSLFDIYPDKLRKGAVVGYRKADGTPLKFPCTLDTGNATMDAKGRWTASGLGLKPVIAKYTEALKRTEAVEAWIGDGFGINPKSRAWNLSNDFKLQCVQFVDGVTSIGNCAFGSCQSLTSITIPDGVTSIGDWAFRGCSALTSIIIPDGVTEIGDSAFSWCVALTDITIPKTIEKIGDRAFLHCKLTSITIPDGVTHIGRSAFYGCTALTSVMIPDGVTSIGDCAFYDCTALTDVMIPEGVTSVGNYAFHGCTNLTDVYVDQPQSNLLNNVLLPAGCTVHWKQEETV